MFAIFKSGKQISEMVSTLVIASELLKGHRKQEPSANLEIKAKVKKLNSAGLEVKTKAGKNSTQWISLDEYNKRLNEIEPSGLF